MDRDRILKLSKTLTLAEEEKKKRGFEGGGYDKGSEKRARKE